MSIDRGHQVKTTLSKWFKVSFKNLETEIGEAKLLESPCWELQKPLTNPKRDHAILRIIIQRDSACLILSLLFVRLPTWQTSPAIKHEETTWCASESVFIIM